MSAEIKAGEEVKHNTHLVYKAINDVSQELLSGIAKNSKNQGQGFMFRGIDAVYNALAPALVKHNLIIIPRITERQLVERQTQKGGSLNYVVVKAEFDFISTLDGSKLTVENFGEAMDSGDKGTNKAMSIAYKYAAFQTFCIPTEDMKQDDPDAYIHEPVPQKQAKPVIDTSAFNKGISIISKVSNQDGMERALEIFRQYSLSPD